MPLDVLLETHNLLIGRAGTGRLRPLLRDVGSRDGAGHRHSRRSRRNGYRHCRSIRKSGIQGDSGQRMTAAERGHALLRLADLIRKDEDSLVELESLDSGKPVSSIRRQDLPAVLDTLTYYAGWADKINGQVIPTRRDALTYTVREPMGVVGAIIPWNFPLMIGMWKIAPALACGCTVVLKPAELTPLTALRLG